MHSHSVTSISLIQPTDESQTWMPIVAAIVGAAAGALLGALTTYLIGNRERKKQIDSAKFDRQRVRFLAGNRAVLSLESRLNELLFRAMGNRESYEDLSKGIFDKESRNSRILLSLPAEYDFNQNVTPDILNGYLINRCVTCLMNQKYKTRTFVTLMNTTLN